MANKQIVWQQKSAPIFNTGVDVKVWRDMDQPDLGIAFTLQVEAIIFDTPVGTFQGPLQNGPFSVNIPLVGNALQGTVSDAMFETPAGAAAERIEDVASLYFVITGSGGLRVPLKHLPIRIPMHIPTTTVVVPIPQTSPGSTVPPPPIRIPPKIIIPVDIPPIDVAKPPFNVARPPIEVMRPPIEVAKPPFEVVKPQLEVAKPPIEAVKTAVNTSALAATRVSPAVEASVETNVVNSGALEAPKNP